jgi:hypothetical protein
VVVTELREACARVARQARHVRINLAQIPEYAASLPAPTPARTQRLSDPAERELAAWYWLTLDAINFGSGWFPTLTKPPGQTGYSTISSGLRRRFDDAGPWSARELSALTPASLAGTFGQNRDHELMARFAGSLNDLGRRLETDYASDPLQLIDAVDHHATELVERLATWACFADVSTYTPAGTTAGQTISVPFLKRAQIAAADLARSGVVDFVDLAELTMFADNLVPHVLRLDGILDFDAELLTRIGAGELIEHGSAEEVEIRACAVAAVELVVAASPRPVTAAQLDELLWQRGQGPLYKGSPRHRSRCTAY